MVREGVIKQLNTRPGTEQLHQPLSIVGSKCLEATND